MNRCTADQFPTLQRAGNVVQLKRLSHRHEAIMDFLLANPQMKLAQVAEYFKVTGPWLSTVIHSDLFRTRMAHRREAMEGVQHMRISQKLLDIAEDGLGAMHDVVQDTEIDPKTKLDITRTSLEAIGILGKAGGGVGAVNVNVTQNADPHAADAQALREARERMVHTINQPKAIENAD